MTLTALKEAWDNNAPSDREPWNALLDDCIERHGEPHRRYHGVSHLAAVYQALQQVSDNVDAVQLAATVLHDAIYDPTRSDNETRSATHAVAALAPTGMTDRKIAVVAEIIEATAAHHLPDPVRAPERVKVFLDADLSILGAPREVYEKYRRQIRAEYHHIAEEDFRTGRAALLSSFLNRPELYFTPAARSLWEQSARANLAAEIATLSSQA